MSSTELLEAASISTTSSDVAAAIETRDPTRAPGSSLTTLHPAVGAVQRLGENLRHRRLARPARADEQVGMVDAPLLDGVGERPDDVLLPDDVGKCAGAMTAIQTCHGDVR